MNTISLRPATIEDCNILLSWVNNANSLKWKKDTNSIISHADHKEWLKHCLSCQGTMLWIIMEAEKPVGQVRLEKKIDAVHIDIYLIEDCRGKGYANKALNSAIKKYFTNFGPEKFIAVIHKDNQKSLKLFAESGFITLENTYCKWLTLELNLEF